MPQIYELDIDGFDVTVILKSVKNMYLRVKPPDARVEVTAPYYVHSSDVVNFVQSKTQWIDEARDRIFLQSQKAHERGTGENVLTHWTVDRQKQARAILESKLPSLLKKWGRIIDRTPSHITLRVMKTRWGSCTPATGRIRLNLALAFVPDELLEYVLVHELTHLYERGHGEGFKRRMSQYLPDWQRKRRALNSYGSY
ncbi:M48 family metallopeptidase [Alloscardovia criceti]|uniref:M48 family metallopeptidase n=1 Tax=Alloscardovia criceti TaxID=356828 RepID=UPI00037FE7AF|nr:SprT family zinc-dependent metalloprotease [Alloscardovia criceti]